MLLTPGAEHSISCPVRALGLLHIVLLMISSVEIITLFRWLLLEMNAPVCPVRQKTSAQVFLCLSIFVVVVLDQNKIYIFFFSCECYYYIIMFPLVPCAPEVTATHLECNTDSVLLQWTPTDGSISYTADARTPEGLVSTCSSNSTNCELRGLACGQTYNVTMVSYDGHCHSMPGTALAVASGRKEKIN